MTESLLKPGERLDDLQRNGLHIICLLYTSPIPE